MLRSKKGWEEIGGKRIYFRSSWEFKYAKYLEWLKLHESILDWEHEPKTFWFEGIKRGVVSYLPDFRVLNSDGSHFWVEVKGYMDSKSKTKIKRMRKYFPDEKLIIADSDWFKKNGSRISGLIANA